MLELKPACDKPPPDCGVRLRVLIPVVSFVKTTENDDRIRLIEIKKSAY